MMTKRKVAAEMCKREKGKSEAKIGDVMQLLGHFFDIMEEAGEESVDFMNKEADAAAKRAKKK